MTTTLERQPIRIPKAAVVVAGHLRRGIIRAEFGLGDALPNETELMRLYDVSRPVVREALRILESEGLIAVKRGAGGGARVRRPDIGIAARHTALLLQLEGTTLSDLFEARSILEPAAVGRLAEKRSPDALRRLKQRHEQELVLTDDAVAYPTHAALFHDEIIELAGNKTLAVLGRLLLEIVETHNRATFGTLDTVEARNTARTASEWHGTVIGLIESGDVEAAVDHWRRHLDIAAEIALQHLGPTTVVDLLDHDLPPG